MKFNYFITIHNKESLLQKVIESVVNVMSETSTLYTVLDGCTDQSESIVDTMISSYENFRIMKVFANDVHELKAINLGIKSSDQEGEGFNIILQDDVVLNEPNLEQIVENLYKNFDKLGIISFRHGGNLDISLLNKKKFFFPITNYIENVSGHNPLPFNRLRHGYFSYRDIVIKSPICIPFYITREIGLPDERYAPWDDIAFCYTVRQAGYDNGILSIDFISEVEWGTTRIIKQKNHVNEVQVKNLNLFKQLQEVSLKTFRPNNNLKKYKIFDAVEFQEKFTTSLIKIYIAILRKLKFKINIWLSK